jgi:hypothetical protein
MDITQTFILALAVWRISYALTAEDGPMNIFIKLRSLKLGGLFDCIYCTSIWVGFIAIWLWLGHFEALLYPFALSGLAMMLRSYTGAGIHD